MGHAQRQRRETAQGGDEGRGHKHIRRYYLYALAALVVFTGVLNIYQERRMERIKLFFIRRSSGRLAIQRCNVPRVGSTNERIQWIMRELIAGPVDSRYERTVDPQVAVKEIIVQSTTAYISFDWGFVDSLSKNPKLAVQSIVSSVLRNIRELDDVRILIDGIEPVNTFFGASPGRQKNR
jgi:hypothetical protein